MKIAIIDLGTNTFHLLIAEINSDYSYSIIHQENESVQLGKGGISINEIQTEAMERGFSTLKKFMEIIQNAKINKAIAIGTSALRNAKNGIQFTDKVEKDIGIKIEIVTGDQEAELIFLGVNEAINISELKVLTMDIGGGSVEFIISQKNKILWKKSFEIGVARLINNYSFSKELEKKESILLNDFLKTELKELIEILKIYPCKILIGSAGSFETFAAMCENNIGKNSFSTPSYLFDIKELNKVLQLLEKSTLAERRINASIIPLRVEMIVPAAIITKLILQMLVPQEVYLSTFALKEGVLVNFINQIKNNQA